MSAVVLPAPKLLHVERFRVAPAAELWLPLLPKSIARELGRILLSGSKSNYLSKKLQDHVFGATTFTTAATTYWALWTATLDDTSTLATTGEAAYTSYARVALTNNTTNWPNATGTTTSSKTTGADATFPASTGGTATVTFVCVGDAASGAGNIYLWGSVTSTAINSGDTPKVASGAPTYTED